MMKLAQASDAGKYATLYKKLHSSELNDSQFTLWIAVQDGERINKKPINPYTGKVHDAHDRDAWVDLKTACERAQYFNSGVGFVLTENDPFFFLDIDHCLETSNQWSPLAVELCSQFQGAYIEVSQSGRGLHIIGSYSGNLPPHSNKNIQLGLELYTEKRFVALTGWCDG